MQITITPGSCENRRRTVSGSNFRRSAISATVKHGSTGALGARIGACSSDARSCALIAIPLVTRERHGSCSVAAPTQVGAAPLPFWRGGSDPWSRLAPRRKARGQPRPKRRGSLPPRSRPWSRPWPRRKPPRSSRCTRSLRGRQSGRIRGHRSADVLAPSRDSWVRSELAEGRGQRANDQAPGWRQRRRFLCDDVPQRRIAASAPSRVQSSIPRSRIRLPQLA